MAKASKLERAVVITEGREVLIKSIALSIPTYAMSCFLVLKVLCSKIESMMAMFWWGQKKNERKIHWLSMCEPKHQGRLGFKDLRSFNHALLAKQGWRILHEEGSLLHKIYKAQYFPKGQFFDAGLGYSPSYAWRGLWEAKKWLIQCCR